MPIALIAAKMQCLSAQAIILNSALLDIKFQFSRLRMCMRIAHHASPAHRNALATSSGRRDKMQHAFTFFTAHFIRHYFASIAYRSYSTPASRSDKRAYFRLVGH